MTVHELIGELQLVRNKKATVCLGDRNRRRIFPEEELRPKICRVDHEHYLTSVFLDIEDK